MSNQMKPPEAMLRHKSAGTFLSGCGEVDPVAEHDVILKDSPGKAPHRMDLHSELTRTNQYIYYI